MAQSFWYAHYFADYARDTAHLSMLEHGAYRLMLDHYYSTRTPLPTDVERVLRLCRAFVQAEQDAVRLVLKEFFDLREDGWHNERADEEIRKAAELRDKCSAAGQASARKRNKAVNKTATTVATSEQQDTQQKSNYSQSQSQKKEDEEEARPRDPPKLEEPELPDSLNVVKRTLKRVCEILRVELQADPERVTWHRQIEEMLRDGLSEQQIIAATEIARTRGNLRLSYIRAIAFNPPKPAPTASPQKPKDDVLERMKERERAKQNEQVGRNGDRSHADEGNVLPAAQNA